MTSPTGRDLSPFPQGPSSPLVVISILNWNGWQETLGCLASVRQLRYANYVVVVVENGSRDGSLQELQSWAKANYRDGEAFVEYSREIAMAGGDEAGEASLESPGAKRRMVLIVNRENQGFTTGNNVTIQYALRRPHPADYVLLLNNDAAIHEDCLDQLINVSDKTQAGVVGAVMKERESGRVQFAGYGGSNPLLQQFFHPLFRLRPVKYDPASDFHSSTWVSGAAMGMRRETLEAVRRATGWYLDDGLFIYGDEADFSGRARKLGFETVVAFHAVVYHGEASSMGGRYNPSSYYYLSRNQIRLAGRFLPWYLRPFFHAFHVALCTGRALLNLLRGRADSARAILLGVFDGYRGVVGKWKGHDRAARLPEAPKESLPAPGSTPAK